MKKEVSRTGWLVSKSEDGWHGIVLDWIPCAKKSRVRSMYNKALGRIMHFPDKLVVTDTAAVRAILLKGWRKSDYESRREYTVDWELAIKICRPLSAAERKRGTPNQRRGDTVSAHELICDALTGYWYKDDSQVTKLTIEEDRFGTTPMVTIMGRAR